MAQTTEAACLLQTGALYTKRIGLLGPSGELVFAGTKRGAFSLYFDDAPIYHFDLEGRWQRAFLDGIHYRKGLDNSVVAIDRVREGANLVLKRRTLSYAEAADLDAAIRDVALALIERVESESVSTSPPPDSVRPMTRDDLRDLLDRIARWDASAWFAHRERYLAAYGPIGFLPPDAHQCIVLQATIGDLGRGFGGGEPIEHAIRTPSEFADHSRAVARLLGRRALQNNGVFLGGADVLQRPFEDVQGYFDAIGEVFPLRESANRPHFRQRPEDEVSLGGVDLLVLDPSPGLPDRDGLASLKAKGLRRINIGVESGNERLRSQSGASWSDRDLCAFVSEAAAAGVALGIILLVGVGGEEGASSHVKASLDLFNGLDMRGGDLVYLIDAAELGAVGALGPEQAAVQTKVLREGLTGVRARGAKVAPYSLDKQWN